MTLWQAVTWDVTRAGGFTAYILATLSVVVGLALSMQWQSSSKWPRLVNNELHNFLTLVALIFTGIHILAAWVDPYAKFGWYEIFVPMLSHIHPLGMAFGIIGLYLGLAIGLSSWLRPRIGYTWWRRLHFSTLLLFALVTAHSIMTGSDTKTWWALTIYLVSMVLVAGLLILRLLAPVNAKGRAHPVLAVATMVALTVGAVWMCVQY